MKIIVTNDYDIKSQITRATNNQTAVGIEQLEALSEFQKNLELFYNALPNDDLKLFYERRTNQYRDSDYVSSIAYIKIEEAFNKGIISDELWRFRYHILMLYRMISAGPDIPPMNSKKIIIYCNKIITSLRDEDFF